MSADNWADCPNCKAIADKARERRVRKANEAYGKVPADAYQRLFNEAADVAKPGDTLRENYGVEILSDGEFYVSYSGLCEVCGFVHKFKHSEKLTIPGKEIRHGDD